jgi:DNA-binding response OmpR family regulator
MLTGRGQKGDREKSLDAGADDFFEKPFSPLALIKKVEEVLG